MKYLFTFLTCLTLVLPTLTFSLEGCDGPSTTPISVSIDGCSDANERCKIKRGEDLRITMDFNAAVSAERLTPVLKVKKWFITYMYDMPPHLLNGCNSLRLGMCPMERGDFGRYGANLPINKSWPAWVFEVKMYLVNEDGKVVTCAKGEAELV